MKSVSKNALCHIKACLSTPRRRDSSNIFVDHHTGRRFFVVMVGNTEITGKTENTH
jgi:hypothetical protein